MYHYKIHFFSKNRFFFVLEQLENLTDEEENQETSFTASPSREVSPKFIVDGKKYGRRSRPPSAAFDSSQSESENEYNTSDAGVVPGGGTTVHNSNTKSKTVQKVKVILMYTVLCIDTI